MTQAQLRVTPEQVTEMLAVYDRNTGRTPLPWSFEDDGDDYVIFNAKAEVGRVPHGQDSDINVHTIADAVNSYRDLLETVEHLTARVAQSEAKMREYVEACDAMDNFPTLSDPNDYNEWCQRFDAAGSRVQAARAALRATPSTGSPT